ncbi:MAG: hypothetical protein Q4G35_10740 [Propionibacteriaceae bacterium]|nr:hypothetical protein [Propionibacteriaceae bacterium]
MDLSEDFQQRAQDNERLRALAVTELESTRDQLAETVSRLQRAREDLIKTNQLLVTAVAEHEAMTQEKGRLEEELAEAKDVAARQKAYIERLRQQLDKPLRAVVKKATRTLRPGARG